MRQPVDNAYTELLVLRAQGGDARALEALVEHWHSRLWRQASRLTGDADAAADITQECWLAVVRGLRRLEDPACFRPWAYRIVTNKCADWVRRRMRNRRALQPLNNDPPANEQVPAEREDELASLRRALAQLPAERRTILAMFYLDEMPVREIADALSLRVGTVKSRLFHARQHLKQILEGDDS